MTWTLVVYLVVIVNTQPVLVPTLLAAPIEFQTPEACLERGKRYAHPKTKVACVAADGRQIELGEL